MVSGEDCPCTDATEASNITSLQSDASCMLDTNVKDSYSERMQREDHKFQEHNHKDCQCYEKSEQCKRLTEKGKQSPKKDSSKDQSSLKQMQLPRKCICCAHKIAYTLPLQRRYDKTYTKPFWCRFKWKWPKKDSFDRKDKTYEVKLKQKKCPHYEEISEGIPNKRKQRPREITKAPPPQEKEKDKEMKKELMEKIDIYYFDHGNSAYYRTTDSPPILVTEKCAERTDQVATRFWAEIFGTIHIGTAFVTAFILQLLRFTLYSIIRPLTVGILQLLADYFIKPFLSIIFNALIQPVLILLYNIATSFKDLCEPIAEAMGLFLREIANLCAAIRVVEVKQGTAPSVACT